MAYILNIETATSVCSVALAKSNKIVHLKESDEPNLHSSQLTVFIEKLFTEAKMEMNQLNAVAVSKGPGSYTGLRIGVSVAKGICYALNIPLIAVSTLQSMAYGFVQHKNMKEDNAWFCPMIDARRMEVYSAFYDRENQLKKDISADIIDKNSYLDILSERKVHFFGNGAEKCKGIMQHQHAIFTENFAPSAKYMTGLAYQAFNRQDFEHTAYFEPFYLKDFIATTPKKNIFR